MQCPLWGKRCRWCVREKETYAEIRTIRIVCCEINEGAEMLYYVCSLILNYWKVKEYFSNHKVYGDSEEENLKVVTGNLAFTQLSPLLAL